MEEYNNNLGTLDCELEKEYVIKQIYTIFETDRLIEKHLVKSKLLEFNLEKDVDEILKYAVKNGILSDEGSFYLKND